jgi:hypothetical protein
MAQNPFYNPNDNYGTGFGGIAAKAGYVGASNDARKTKQMTRQFEQDDFLSRLAGAKAAARSAGGSGAADLAKAQYDAMHEKRTWQVDRDVADADNKLKEQEWSGRESAEAAARSGDPYAFLGQMFRAGEVANLEGANRYLNANNPNISTEELVNSNAAYGKFTGENEYASYDHMIDPEFGAKSRNTNRMSFTEHNKVREAAMSAASGGDVEKYQRRLQENPALNAAVEQHINERAAAGDFAGAISGVPQIVKAYEDAIKPTYSKGVQDLIDFRDRKMKMTEGMGKMKAAGFELPPSGSINDISLQELFKDPNDTAWFDKLNGTGAHKFFTE